MDILRLKYEALCNKEAYIRNELCRAQERNRSTPTLWVFHWFSAVARVKIQVLNIERSFQVMKSGCFSNWLLVRKRSRFVVEISKQVDELECAMKFSSIAELVGRVRFFVDQCPHRAKLLDTIWQNLMDPEVGITNIYGNKAVGKTTAIGKIRSKLLIESHSFDKVIFVTVSSNWGLDNVQREIALQIDLDISMCEDPRTALHGSLEETRFLIIFDDLRERIPLCKVGIPQPTKENGCKIVLMSRELEFCHGSIESNDLLLLEKVIKVEDLSAEEAWDLFVAKAGDTVITPAIQPLARKLVQVCPGIPVLILAVAHAMKDVTRTEVWWEIVQNIYTIHVIPFSTSIFSNIIRLCYARLKSYVLRHCLLFCALFPQDYLFTPEELITYWMAEGFIHEYGDIVAETNEGYKIIEELQDANMLETLTKNGEKWLKIQDFFRQFALRIISNGTQAIIKKEVSFLTEWDEAKGIQEISFFTKSLETKRFSLTEDNIGSVLHNSNHVSTLLLHDNKSSYNTAASVLRRTLNLKFLYISCYCITELPSSVSELAHLRALLLPSCTRLTNMPTLKMMTKLQYLSLRGTSITSLPEGMERLVGLRFLDLSETANLNFIRPGVISSLSCLEELRMRKTGLCKMTPAAVASYLREVRFLKRLAILTLSTVESKDLYDTITCLQEQSLQIYSINVYGSVEDYVEDVETM